MRVAAQADGCDSSPSHAVCGDRGLIGGHISTTIGSARQWSLLIGPRPFQRDDSASPPGRSPSAGTGRPRACHSPAGRGASGRSPRGPAARSSPALVCGRGEPAPHAAVAPSAVFLATRRCLAARLMLLGRSDGRYVGQLPALPRSIYDTRRNCRAQARAAVAWLTIVSQPRVRDVFLREKRSTELDEPCATPRRRTCSERRRSRARSGGQHLSAAGGTIYHANRFK